MRKVDLKECVANLGDNAPPTLQELAQDLADIEQLNGELMELVQHPEALSDEQKMGLEISLDIAQIMRVALSRSIYLVISWASKLGEITEVEIDDTVNKFISIEKVPQDDELEPTTIIPKGSN